MASSMLSPQQHGHCIAFEAGCRNIELAVLVDVSDGDVICAGAGAERRACRRDKPASAAEPHCDAVDGGYDKIIFPVLVDIRNCNCERLSPKVVWRRGRGTELAASVI